MGLDTNYTITKELLDKILNKLDSTPLDKRKEIMDKTIEYYSSIKEHIKS